MSGTSDRGVGSKDDYNLETVAARLETLPTPLSTDYNTPASEWDTNNDRLQLQDINALLPTLPTPTTDGAKHQAMDDQSEVQLMGTPTAAMSVRSEKFKRLAENPAEFVESLVADPLLPTLPTPTTDAGRQSGQCRDFNDLLHAVTHDECKVATLPTPHAGLGERGRDGVYPNPKGQQDLQHTLAHLMPKQLLPTPAVNDMGAGKDPEQFEEWRLRQKSSDGRTAVHGKSLHQEALKSEIDWGKYEPAITRWESMTRPVPEPTVPYKEKRRLNPEFVEWMMGLSAGWVTGHGLSAAKELKMLGNGVCPQQAHAAISALMERTCQS